MKTIGQLTIEQLERIDKNLASIEKEPSYMDYAIKAVKFYSKVTRIAEDDTKCFEIDEENKSAKVDVLNEILKEVKNGREEKGGAVGESYWYEQDYNGGVEDVVEIIRNKIYDLGGEYEY